MGRSWGDGRARSSAGEHYVDIVGVTGSIPVAPTILPSLSQRLTEGSDAKPNHCKSVCHAGVTATGRIAMATIRKRLDKWQVQVRRKGFKVESRTFHRRADAEEWARHIEVEADRRGLPADRKRLQTITT